MMIKSSLVCGLVTALLCAPVLRAQDPAPAPATPAAPAEAAPDLSDLDHAIDYGISVLEKKDYVTFFKTFADPAMIKAMTEKGGSVDDLAKAVSPKAAEGILFALKAAKSLKPKMEDDGNKATYTFPDDVVKEHNLRKSEMSFFRVDKRWYLKSDPLDLIFLRQGWSSGLAEKDSWRRFSEPLLPRGIRRLRREPLRPRESDREGK